MLWQYSAIHAVPSACSSCPPGRQRRAAIEHADVVEPQETTLKNIPAVTVLAIYPPPEIKQQFPECIAQERHVAFSANSFLSHVYVMCRPRVHRRIHIAEIP